MRPWYLLVIGLFIAGCAGPVANDDAETTPEPAELAFTGLELSDCHLDDFIAFVESSRLRPLVPPEYETGSYFGTHELVMTGVVDVSLRVLECQADSAQGHDDRARLAASISFLYDSPQELGAYGATNLYLLELFVDAASAPGVVAFFTVAGIEFIEASITLSDTSAVIEAEGLRYVVGPDADAGPTAGAPFVSGRGFDWERWHVLQGDLPAWLDLIQPPATGGQAYGMLEAEGGAWEALAGPGNPPLVGAWAILDHEASIQAWSAPDPLPFPRARSSDPKGLHLLDCDGWEFQMQFPAETVAALLPSGYEAGFQATVVPNLPALAGLPAARLDHDVLSCNAYIDGVSQGRPTLAWTAALLAAADGHEGDLFRDVYVLEWYGTNVTDALASLLAAQGFTIQPAQVDLSPEGASMKAEGVQYSFACGPDVSLSGNGLPGQRNHVVAEDTAYWLDLEGTVWRHEPGSPSARSANGGVLGSLDSFEGLSGLSNCARIYGTFDGSFGSS